MKMNMKYETIIYERMCHDKSLKNGCSKGVGKQTAFTELWHTDVCQTFYSK